MRLLKWKHLILGIAWMLLLAFNPAVLNAQEMHPGPRSTCPICRSRVAAQMRARIESDGKDPRSISSSEMREYIRSVKQSSDFDPDLVVTENTLRRYGIGVAQPRSPKSDFVAEDRAFARTLNKGESDLYLVVELTAPRNPTEMRSFSVHADESGAMCAGSDVRMMAQTIRSRMVENNSSTVYLIPRGLTVQKRDVFVREATRQLRELDPKIEVRAVKVSGETPVSKSLLLSRESRISSAQFSRPALVTQGRFKGFYTATTRILQGGRVATLRFYARSKEALLGFQAFLSVKLNGDYATLSPSQVVTRARSEFAKSHGYSENEIITMYTDELGNTQVVRDFSRISRFIEGDD